MGFDLRWILDREPLMKKQHLQPQSVQANPAHADFEICTGNGLLGHEADPMST
jgi:hypothetical protein